MEPRHDDNDEPKGPWKLLKSVFAGNTLAIISGIVMLVALAYFGWGFYADIARPAPTEITAEEFSRAVETGHIQDVTYNTSDQTVSGTWDDPDGTGSDRYMATYSFSGLDNLKDSLANYPSIPFTVKSSSAGGMSSQGWAFLLVLVCMGIIVVSHGVRKRVEDDDEDEMSLDFNRSGFNGAAGRRRKRKQEEDEKEMPQVTFADVAGCEEALEEVAEVKDFLMNPAKFTRLGAKIPCGILMSGPPGCGKTLMAKAIAGESGVPFYSMSGSDFVEKYVGVGASRVRELFTKARKCAPCIIFIDEIDAIGKKRASGNDLSNNDEQDRTLNQLLVEMDGFSAADAIIVIGASNRIDTLDPALLRPGRFDRHISVDLPDVGGREQILQVHSANKPLAGDVDLHRYAVVTSGMSGAELANLCNEAAIFAARKGKDAIGKADMDAAFERLVAGAEKKGRVLSENEKRTTAYHEAGHAIVGHMLEGADKVSKISIVSRGKALGYTLTLPEEDHFLYTRRQLKDKLAMLMGGLVAEEMVNDYDISTGPSNDLERATQMATAMATRYGMFDELGRRAFVPVEDSAGFYKPYSEEKGRQIDDAVDAIMEEAHDEALALLTRYRDRLDAIAQVLIEQEVVEGQEMEDLLDGCWKGKGAYAAVEPFPSRAPFSEASCPLPAAEEPSANEDAGSGDDIEHSAQRSDLRDAAQKVRDAIGKRKHGKQARHAYAEDNRNSRQ